MIRRIESRVVVNNVPLNAKKYIVVRLTDGALWYWGSWDELDRANECMYELNNQNSNALVVENGIYIGDTE